MRHLLLTFVAVVVIILAVSVLAYRSALQTPVVRRTTVSIPNWPAGTAPITIAVLSDIHIGNATMDGARVADLAAQVNALRPNLVLIAGDFVATDTAEITALADGIGRLRAPLGIIAVLGNHDHWTSAPRIRAAVERTGAIVLANQAVRRGPLVVGGIDDMTTRHADVTRTVTTMRTMGGAGVVLSHSPDVAPRLPSDVTLVLAGHTHCGQIVLPLLGPPVDVAQPRYRCGVVREGTRTMVVTAGIGTSVLPFRFGAPPDVWLVRVGR